ncbi:uncharacterized protein LOC132755682, partial [Ruditapes philippinarum]|uniref:uncharacterized protein LOC132755682 n=1 Tax=Ruditapes philippinarum TaxID=129788 RepID=UPI00295A871C
MNKTDFTVDLAVYNNSREKIKCDYNISLTDLQSMKSAIKPGYYWNTGKLYGTAEIDSTGENNTNIQSILCGAYRSSIGMYYANCKEERFSLCSSNDENGLINNFCFDEINTSIARTTVRQKTTTDKTDISTKHPMTGMTTLADNKTKEKTRHTKEDEQSSDLWIYIVVPLGVVLILTFGI